MYDVFTIIYYKNQPFMYSKYTVRPMDPSLGNTGFNDNNKRGRNGMMAR